MYICTYVCICYAYLPHLHTAGMWVIRDQNHSIEYKKSTTIELFMEYPEDRNSNLRRIDSHIPICMALYSN
jgi:hypothetical protein